LGLKLISKNHPFETLAAPDPLIAGETETNQGTNTHGRERTALKLVSLGGERHIEYNRQQRTLSMMEITMAQLKNILLVDDDDDLREALSEQLVMTEDFEVFEADCGAQAMERAKEALYDLIILDVGLPDTDGRELCRLMRKQGVKSPILMLTGHDSDADTVLGLDAGANDYVSKPFKFPVLLARIRAQLRQHEQSEDAVFTLGPYTFKPSMKILTTDDEKKIRLTEKETNILKFLYRSTDGVVARDVLLHEVWGYNAGVTTHTLETHIYRLRQKIEPDPSNARLLVTESGGYRLVA
jgi:DNA-binding response OmpR family regulator